MKEARIIFPRDKADQTTAIYHGNKAIIAAFGGCTESFGNGFWIDKEDGKEYAEQVCIFDIAYEQNAENDAKLYDIAWKMGQDAKQKEVYLRYGNGNVQMIKEIGCMDNGTDQFDWEAFRADLHRVPDDPNDIVEHAEHVAI